MPQPPSQRLPKINRILKRDGFKRVYDNGEKVHTRYFTAFTLANSETRPRIGITATRKIGNSVERNRARRLVREVFRKNKWLADAGVDIVINVKRSLVEACYQEVEVELVTLLQRVGKR